LIPFTSAIGMSHLCSGRDGGEMATPVLVGKRGGPD
jgi:hypothetical protein